MDLSSGTATILHSMYSKCIKCGSEKTHNSRVRRGERTMGTLFLRPIRCRQCKERFWVRNPGAYVALGGALIIVALLITTVGLIIEHNLEDPFAAPVAEIEIGPENSSVARGKPESTRQTVFDLPQASDKSSNDMKTGSSKEPDLPPMQDSADDHHFAVRLYQGSAEKGDRDAQYKLGLLYLTGNGALQDFVEAAKWLKLAAEQGYGLAQYELGMIYRSGYGLPADPVQSYVWLNLAAAAGVQQAMTARDEVMRSLTSKQLTQAQKISRDWLAARPKRQTMADADPRDPESGLLSKPSRTPEKPAGANER